MGGSIEVEASDSGDDTDNIQCALDAAIDGGYRDVFLVSGEYSIGPIEATGLLVICVVQARSEPA